MARAVRLKVYRTPIGFHDAYVAAPSQKAALAAWGSGHDLFSTGEAELVTDPALVEEPLAKPGTIVRRVRGTEAEHIAALPPEPVPPPKPKAKPAESPKPRPTPPPKRKPPPPPPPKPKPRPPKPDREPVDAAKAELDAALAEHERALRELKQREADLRDERRRLEQAQKAAAISLRQKVRSVEDEYQTALARWRDSASKPA